MSASTEDKIAGLQDQVHAQRLKHDALKREFDRLTDVVVELSANLTKLMSVVEKVVRL
jgi:hypothetical protein